jgi:hypothetical protein
VLSNVPHPAAELPPLIAAQIQELKSRQTAPEQRLTALQHFSERTKGRMRHDPCGGSAVRNLPNWAASGAHKSVG